MTKLNANQNIVIRKEKCQSQLSKINKNKNVFLKQGSVSQTAQFQWHEHGIHNWYEQGLSDGSAELLHIAMKLAHSSDYWIIRITLYDFKGN